MYSLPSYPSAMRLSPRLSGNRLHLSLRLRCRAMEHKFGGLPYTIGIEEELMILDAESLELVSAIESLLEPAPAGEIKPELMESVLEVSTDPCRTAAEAGEQ